MSRMRIHIAAIVAIVVATTSAHATVLVPDGLQPGDMYHLAFVTRDGRNATSSDIADYNQFVNDQAVLSGSITENFGINWFAIASTPSTNARDNAAVGLGVPIYLLDGTTKIADGFLDLWDETIDSEFFLDQFVETPLGFVWTGTNPKGFGSSSAVLGDDEPRIGRQPLTHSKWIDAATRLNTTSLPLYALSAELVVVPEPSSMALSAIGVLAVTIFVRVGRKKATPA